MLAWSDIVWVIPFLYGLIFIIGLTVGRSHQRVMVVSSTLLSAAAFIIAIVITCESVNILADDYSYYVDYIIIGDTFFCIGYELNNLTAWLLVLITGMNILLLCLLYHKHDQAAIS